MKKILVAFAVFLTAVGGVTAAVSYTTAFPASENPISEGGAWVTGKALGINWSDVRTTPGQAFGTQTGADGFNDSLAVVQGTWPADQSATATVYTVNQQNGDVFEEVELLLRFAIAPGIARGYELNYSLRNDGSQYAQVVRWNGALGDFTLLDARVLNHVLQTGDQVSATIAGNLLTTYVNGQAIFSVSDPDNAFADGNPGMGFFLQNPGVAGISTADYGFTCFAASEGSTAPPCVPQAPQTGRMTGGGTVVTPSGFVELGLELNCMVSEGPQHLEVTWGGGHRFRLDSLTSATCTDDPNITAPKSSHATFDTYQGKGTGRLDGKQGASAEWTFTDAGEPGRNDTVTIQIRNSSQVVVLAVAGPLRHGNMQAHAAIGREHDEDDRDRRHEGRDARAFGDDRHDLGPGGRRGR